jgi:phosphate:Na+ symporter
MNFALFMGIATGVILFLYGIESFSREIKVIAGEHLRKVLSAWTKSRFTGMLLGAIVTALIQSSTATSVLTVSLVNSAIINFRQSIGILLGINIGTTVTAFLVAMKLTDIGPWFIVLGFMLSVVRIQYSFIGKSLFYFGLVFFALSQLSAITMPLLKDPYIAQYFSALENPLSGVALGCLLTIVIQSSSVVTGLVVIVVQSQSIGIAAAIPIILGANIGTTFTGIIASLSMDTYAKRAAAVNTIFNIGGVLIFLPFLTPFTNFVQLLGTDAGRVTAMAHLIFNAVSAIIFLFLVRQLEWLATKLVKGDENEIIFATLYINKEPSENFEMNLSNLNQELAHFFDVAKSMLSAVIAFVDLRERTIFERILKFTAYADYLAQSCDRYIHVLSVKGLNEHEMDRLLSMLRMVDFVRQVITSQRQIADIPELMRLPMVEEVTLAKAEIFSLFNVIAQIYDHLQAYLRTSDPKELKHIDSVNGDLTKKINNIYRISITKSFQTDRVTSFSLTLLTKVQSIQSKLMEIQRLSMAYFVEMSIPRA